MNGHQKTVSVRTLIAVILSTLSVCAVTAAPSTAGGKNFRVTVHKDTNEIEFHWRGKIAHPMAERLDETIMDHWHHATGGFIISLHSGGGKIREARRVAKIMRDLRRERRVATRVGPGHVCGSACIPIFLQGEIRQVSVASLWKFHEITKNDPSRFGYKFLRPNRTRRLFRKVFLPAGVSSEWLASIQTKIARVDYWLTGANLRDDQSGIGTHYTSNVRKRRKISGIWAQ